MTSLKVIALISGGKDSLFSILHCLANGHEIVALANLHPPSTTDEEDINSFMYQTVGHTVIALYEQALQIPLYRQEISGNAVNSMRDYSVLEENEASDETESLVPLLKRIKAAHPETNAVSTGAILSTYQRTRVESVALRLGLTPLSFLWQYPLLPPYKQSALLHDMAAVGQEAIIIKTASGGLDETFLGLNIADHKTIARLSKAMGRFGEDSIGAILGEGGEFETLALDGPSLLWKKRIELEAAAPAVQDGGTAIFNTKASALSEKQADERDITLKDLRVPDMFDDEFKRVIEQLDHEDTEAKPDPEPTIQDNTTALDGSIEHAWDTLPVANCNDTPPAFTLTNLTGYENERESSTPQRQLTVILLQLDHSLKQRNLLKSSVNHCTLLLRDMADFTLLNPIYGDYFNFTNPPARVTVAVGKAMPQPYDVMLSIVIDKNILELGNQYTRKVDRQGLHVQSRSYWAPANIGPYSQAISCTLPVDITKAEDESHHEVGKLVYVAGQIPLVPATMEVYREKGFYGQAVLSLQHLFRIGRAKHVRWWTSGVAMIAGIPNANIKECVKTAQAAWKAIHSSFTNASDDESDNENDIDPWDLRNRGATFNDTVSRSRLPPRIHCSDPNHKSPVPPCFVAHVSSLPRAVNIEWCATGITSSSISFDPSCNPSIPPPPPPPLPSNDSTPESYSTSSIPPTPTYANTAPEPSYPPLDFIQNPNMTSTTHSPSRFNYSSHVTTFETVEIESLEQIRMLKNIGRNGWANATMYAGPGLLQLWGEVCGRKESRGVQWVPCFEVWGQEGRRVLGVLVGRFDMSLLDNPTLTTYGDRFTRG